MKQTPNLLTAITSRVATLIWASKHAPAQFILNINVSLCVGDKSLVYFISELQMASCEVPGRRTSTPLKPFTYTCNPCSEGGENEEADCFCTICKEFFCVDCASVHRRMRLTRNHRLVDTESMSTQPMEPANENLSEYCAEHPQELIKYYCPDHKSVHCGDCIVRSNHTCKMEILTDVAKGFKDSNEYQILKTKIDDIYKNAGIFKTDMINWAIAVVKLESQSKNDLDRYEEDTIKTLKQKFKELKADVMAKAQANQSSISVLKDKYTAAQTKAQSLKGDLIKKEDNEVDLFIFTQTMRESLKLLCHELENIENDQSKVHSYDLVINSEFRTYLEERQPVVYKENTQLLKPGGESVNRRLRVPEPFQFPITKLKLRFLKSSDVYTKALETQMSMCHSRIVWPETGDMLQINCTLSTAVKDCVKLAATWKDDTERNLRDFYETLEEKTIPVPSDLWDSITKKISEITIWQPQAVAVVLSKKVHQVSVVGLKDVALPLTETLETICQKVQEEAEKQTQMTKQTIDNFELIETRMLFGRKISI